MCAMICLRGDYVKVFLHVDRGGEVSERSVWSNVLCGELADVAPQRLYSSGHAAVLEFHTDRRPGNHSGFMGTFRFIDRRKCVTPSTDQINSFFFLIASTSIIINREFEHEIGALARRTD
ncbi:hypothetical protein B566_EDAN006679 [Ephemera danica]|nr:hypothetical protein B566_EDAN006679 [Ephemera danica]